MAHAGVQAGSPHKMETRKCLSLTTPTSLSVRTSPITRRTPTRRTSRTCRRGRPTRLDLRTTARSAEGHMTSWETAWWIRWPGRLEYELSRLEATGYRLISQSHASGLLEIELDAPDSKTGVGDTRLSVVFPETYPSTAPQVTSRDLQLRHHQHPFGGVLCLIGRSTTYWDSASHLAELLDQQVRKAIAAGSAEPGEQHDEIDQAEPFASYYSYADGLEFLLDDAKNTMPSAGSGQATFLLGAAVPPAAEPGARALCLIESVQSGSVQHEASMSMRQVFGPSPQRATGRWVVLEAPVREDDPAAIWRAAAATDTQGVPSSGVPGPDKHIRLVGFPDELTRTSSGISWVVVIQESGAPRRRSTGRQSGSPAKRAQQAKAPDTYHLGRVDRAGPEDLTARTPLTAPAATRSVLVIGCGAIGSVVIDQLARAGVGRFMLVDKHDVLEPGNLTRHSSTLHGVGLNKAIAMLQHVRSINPHAEVGFGVIPVGLPAKMSDGRTGSEVLAELMDGVDLIIDATAEVGVQEVTADMARVLGQPWLMLSASEGAAGGTVVLVDPDADWCFACFQWHRVDRSVPFPIAITTESIQPVGCAEPTFAGAGFDLAEVSLQACRVALGRLLRNVADSYPSDGFDAWILALRAADGTVVPPTWDGYRLERHGSCRAHEPTGQ